MRHDSMRWQRVGRKKRETTRCNFRDAGTYNTLLAQILLSAHSPVTVVPSRLWRQDNVIVAGFLTDALARFAVRQPGAASGLIRAASTPALQPTALPSDQGRPSRLEAVDHDMLGGQQSLPLHVFVWHLHRRHDS